VSDSRPYKVTLYLFDAVSVITMDLTDEQVAAVRDLAERITRLADLGYGVRVYVERVFAGVRASGGGA
jgi:hypothetical protein